MPPSGLAQPFIDDTLRFILAAGVLAISVAALWEIAPQYVDFYIVIIWLSLLVANADGTQQFFNQLQARLGG